MLISKIILKNKKIYYFNTFQHEKHFKKQPVVANMLPPLINSS